MLLRENFKIQVDSNRSILWLLIGSPNELHYSYKTVCSFHESLNTIISTITNEKLKYVILTSAHKEVWNMGGDLEMFANSVLHRKEDVIKDYAHKCVEVLAVINNGFYNDVIVISVIQGNAFGGGFECALSGGYIIAEEHAKFCFPEVLFGTFPGMGAYSFLTRRLGFTKAHEMITSGKKWTAYEMQKLGLVNFVCKTGRASETILEKIEKNELKNVNPFEKICCQVSVVELKEIVDIWLETTLKLDTRKIEFMQKLADAQKAKMK
jgi:DSF synthase